MTTYQNLDAWKKSMLLVKEVYMELKNYPHEELYALTQQTKRAAVSVPANIAEGVGRNYKKDTIQFLHISRGSLYELETLLNIGFLLDLLTQIQFDKLTNQVTRCIRLINGLINYFEKSSLK